MNAIDEKRSEFWPTNLPGYPKLIRMSPTVYEILESERDPSVSKSDHLWREALKSVLYTKYSRNLRDFHATVVKLYGTDFTTVKLT